MGCSILLPAVMQMTVLNSNSMEISPSLYPKIILLKTTQKPPRFDSRRGGPFYYQVQDKSVFEGTVGNSNSNISQLASWLQPTVFAVFVKAASGCLQNLSATFHKRVKPCFIEVMFTS